MKRLLIAVMLLAFAGVARAQTPAQMDQAKAEFGVAQTAYDLAHYDQALAHFTRAYELSKLPAILFNLGQSYRRLYETGGGLDNLRRAREMYRSYLRLVPISDQRGLAESLLKGVEAEYQKQLHAQRDKLLVEAHGAGALNLAEDFLGQGDLEASELALDRFIKSPGASRSEVARGLRVQARLQAAHGDAQAMASFERALELDPATAPPPDSERAALKAFHSAADRMRGKGALALAHVPPNRLKIGAVPRLRVEVKNDPLAMVRELRVSYRAGKSAYATLSAQPGEVTLPSAFAAGLGPGVEVDYFIQALDEHGAVVDALGSEKEPFELHVESKPEKPIYKRWQFWVGIGAGALVAAGAATAIGITQAPPARVAIPVETGLGVR